MMELPSSLLDRLLKARDNASGVSTDTRAELEGTVFWALRGANFDGNTYVTQALDSGACHAVTTDKTWEGHPDVTVVPDELGALQRLAWACRRRWSCPVLALTGSNGKTTTKELIRDVLNTAFEVHATKGNFNNHIGVPLTLLNAPADPEFVVVEMGANHRKEIAALCAIAEPTHGYITNIGLAHLEGFGGEHGVYLGKKELFDHLEQRGGVAFVQEADSKVIQAAQGVAEKVKVNTPEWRWSSPREGEAGGQVTSDRGDTFQVHLEGSYNLPNVAAACVVGRQFGVSEKDAQQALSSYRPANQRSQAVTTSRNWVLLDAYNANPSSVSHAVNDFASRGHTAPLVLLGDMAELGEVSAEAHRDVAALALQHGLQLWTVGDWFAEAQAASEHSNWTHWASFEELQQALESSPLSGRQVLVKGSRSARLERLLPSL